MIQTKICPFVAAIKKNPNLITLNGEKTAYKTMEEVFKTKAIGAEAAKTDAWWHDGYRKAKAVEEQIKNGTYNVEQPSYYNENGGLNLRYFLS